MGLPRSWWEDSVRHIQFPIVEHNSQFKAFPVSVSPGLYPQQSDLAVQRLRISIRDAMTHCIQSVSYTHLRAHETRHDLVCRLLLEKKKKKMN